MRRALEKVSNMWHAGAIDAEEMGELIKTILRPPPCLLNHKLFPDKDDLCPDCGRPFNDNF